MILALHIGFLDITWVDFIDVTLVSILLYHVYKLIKGSLAVNIFLGILTLYLIYLIVRAAQMELLTNILGQFIGVGVIAMLILFQPELRKFLLLIGRTAEFNRDGHHSLIRYMASRLPRRVRYQPGDRGTKDDEGNSYRRADRILA
ncbi:MAG: hypothetical protein WDO15_16115 [Bacteroidota bacterium]